MNTSQIIDTLETYQPLVIISKIVIQVSITCKYIVIHLNNDIRENRYHYDLEWNYVVHEFVSLSRISVNLN